EPRPVLEEGTWAQRRALGRAHRAGLGRHRAVGLNPRDAATEGRPMTTMLAPGGKLDESAALTPVRIAVLTISDTRDEDSDTSGHVLVERLTGAGHRLAEKA